MHQFTKQKLISILMKAWPKELHIVVQNLKLCEILTIGKFELVQVSNESYGFLTGAYVMVHYCLVT